MRPAAGVGVTIIENDTPTLSIADARGSEGSGGLLFEVVLSQGSSGVVTVDYATADGTAESGADYARTTGTLTFAAETTGPLTIRVAITNDGEDEEEEERFTVELSGESGAALGNTRATGTIEDDDDPAVAVRFGASSYEAAEGGSSAVVSVELSGDPEREVEIVVTAAGANGADSGDYTVSGTTVTFGSGETAKEVTVAAVDDRVDDDGESVTLGLGTLPAGVTEGSPATAVVTLVDNDARGVAVEPRELTVTEGGAGENYTVVLESEPTGAVTVAVVVPTGTDVRVSPERLTFTSGNWSEAQMVTVRAEEDEDALADGVVRLTHTVSGSDYEGETAAGVGVTVVENDTPTLSIADARGVEGSGELLFEVVLSQASSGVVTVEYATADGTAESGADYTETTGTLTFAAETTGPLTIRVAITNDGDDEEEEERFTVELSGESGAALGNPRATGTIEDDDDPAVEVRFGAASYEAAEGGSSAVVAVELSGDPEREVEIVVTAAAGNGADSGDYTVSGTTVTFGSGETSKEVTVAAVDDRVDDDGESVTLGLGTLPAGVTEGSPATAVVTLVDNDVRGVEVEPRELTVTEAGAGESYTVVLETEPTGAVTVAVVVPGGTDVSVSPESLTFTSGNWSESQTVTVEAREDEDALADGVVRLTHAVSGGDYGSETAAGVAVTIREKDEPELSIVDARGSEGSGGLLFEVSLNTASSKDVTVDYATADGTAESGADYTETTGTLTFAAETTGPLTIRVAITNDGEDEEEERFTVELSGAANATLGDARATGTIEDDDDPAVAVMFGAASYEAAEGGSSAVVTVELSGDPERTVEIAVTAAGANGADSGDYTVTGTTVTFGSGETSKEVTVAAVDDGVDDDGESVRLGLGTLPAGVTAGSPATAVVRLADNDVRRVKVEPEGLTVTEGGAGKSYEVELGSEPTGTVTVAVVVPGGRT